MKTINLILLVCLTFISLNGKIYAQKKHIRYFTQGLMLSQCDIHGEEKKEIDVVKKKVNVVTITVDAGTKKIDTIETIQVDTIVITTKKATSFIPQNYQFDIMHSVDGGYVISILEPKKVGKERAKKENEGKDDGSKYTKMKELADMEQNGFYFLLSTSDYETYTEELIPIVTFSTGTVTVPMRLRFGAADSLSRPNGVKYKRYFSGEGSLSLGLAAGITFHPTRSKDFTLSILAGVGPSTVKITPETTNGLIDKETTAGAVTWNVGIVYQWKPAQIGIFIGMDHLSGDLGLNWDYNSQLWLALGLGYSIYELPTVPNKKKQNVFN